MIPRRYITEKYNSTDLSLLAMMENDFTECNKKLSKEEKKTKMF